MSPEEGHVGDAEGAAPSKVKKGKHKKKSKPAQDAGIPIVVEPEETKPEAKKPGKKQVRQLPPKQDLVEDFTKIKLKRATTVKGIIEHDELESVDLHGFEHDLKHSEVHERKSSDVGFEAWHSETWDREKVELDEYEHAGPEGLKKRQLKSKKGKPVAGKAAPEYEDVGPKKGRGKKPSVDIRITADDGKSVHDSRKDSLSVDEEAGRRASFGGRRRSSIGIDRKKSGMLKETNTEMCKHKYHDEPDTDKQLKPLGNEMTAPYFVEKPLNYVTKEKHVAEIPVQIGGNPVPRVRWYKGSRELFPSMRYAYYIEENTNTITMQVRKTRSTDDGYYMVKLDNPAGEASEKFKLMIECEGGMDFRSMLKHREYEEWELAQMAAVDANLKVGEGGERRPSQVEIPKVELKKVGRHKRGEGDDSKLMFLKELHDSNAKEGKTKSVRMDAIFCKPDQRVQWFKDRQEIFPGRKYHIEIVGDNYILVVRKPTVDDGGIYSLKINKCESIAYLSVEEPDPKFFFTKLLPKRLDIDEKLTAILECSVSDKRAQVTWYKDGVLLENNDPSAIDINTMKHSMTKDHLNRCFLKVFDAQLSDEADYMCKINDETHTITTLFVEEIRYQIVKSLLPQNVIEDEDALFKCEVSDTQAPVKWFKDGKEISLDDDKYVIGGEGKARTLLVKHCDLTNSPGKYECRTNDPHYGDSFAKLKVEPANDIIKKLAPVQCKEGEKMEFEAVVRDSTAKVSWYHGEDIIKPVGRIKIIQDGNQLKLVIEDAQMFDSGEYTVKSGEISSTAEAQVLEAERPVVFGKVKDLYTGTADQDLEIDLPYNGTKPTAQLFKDGKLVKKNIEIKVQKRHIKIKLRKPKRGDKGQYELRATNVVGETRCPLSVNILDIPTMPEGPLETSNVYCNQMDLSWHPPLDDGSCPIEKYIVEKNDISHPNEWIPAGECTEPQITVEQLREKKSYKFRVRAVNRLGTSEPLETQKATLAKNPYDEPDKAGVPEITDWDKDRVDMKWEPPLKDGGAPIDKYIIEKKSGVGEWKVATEVPGDQTAVSCTNVTPGKEYQFRVRAINKAGPGPPSDPSKPVFTKPRFLRPHIDRTGVKDIVVKAGQPVSIELSMIGEPPPEKIWTFGNNNEPVENESRKGRVHIKKEDYKIKMSIQETVRKDTGPYTLTATNGSGSDSIVINVTILAKPRSPEGPLEVHDVFKDRCKVSFKKPTDDGGLKLDKYIVEALDMTRGIWTPMAEISGDMEHPQGEVLGLTPGKEYKFRVKAINKQGESEPLVTDKPILARDPWDPASKPGTPAFEDWDKDHVDLSWTPPESDGGAPITAYIIEKREKGLHEWHPSAEIPAPATDVIKGTCKGLEAGKEYEYRIRAVNAAGPGEPSDATPYKKAKPRYLRPKIDKSHMKPITIKAGQSFGFDVPLEGEPPPEKEWFHEGKPIITPGHAIIENHDYGTMIEVPQAKRGDTGVYKLRVHNSSGEDTAQVQVIVLDKPLVPEGPLEVCDVFKDKMTLKWKKPKDDGGTPIKHYEVEKFDVQRGTWIPAGTSKAPEIICDGLIPGKEYKFRVKAINSEGESEPLTTDHATLAKDPWDPASKPGTPDITDWDKDHVDLEWTKPEDDGGSPIDHYIIEKKEKQSNFWQECAKVPGEKTAGTAPLLDEGKEYTFRVRAVTNAGPGEPSDPSRSQIAKPRYLKPKLDLSKMEDIKVLAGETIHFDIPIIGEPPPDKEWTMNGKPIVADDDRITLDNEDYNTRLLIRNAQRDDSGKFCLKVTNSSGEQVGEVNVVVLDVPTSPVGPLEVNDVHKEGCTLAWKLPKDDGGSGIQVFRVDKLDMATGRWVPAGEVDGKETSIELENLTPGHEYKFRVKACNKQGESAPLETHKPVIAKNPYDEPDKPGTPNVDDWDSDHVDLSWTAPENDGGAPIESYVIEKKDENGDWAKAIEIPAVPGVTDVKGTVPDLIEGTKYEFRVRAVNKAGPGEPSDASRAQVAKPRNLKPKIYKDRMEPIRIKEGQKIEFLVPFDGEPMPEVTWLKNDIPIDPSPRTSIVNTADEKTVKKQTQLTTNDAVRHDSGMYTLKVKNANGEDECTVEVVVLSPPAAPGGPLDAVDVRKDRCKLKWKKPKDDGGQDLSHYAVEKFDKALGIWQEVDRVKGEECNVDRLNPGHEYMFRVKAVNRQGESEPLVTLEPIVAKDPWDPPGAPGKPNIEDWNVDHIDVSWDPPIKDGGAPIEGYVIEKKEKGNPFWSKAAEVPGTSFRATCPNLVPGTEYEFRVRAVNIAGVGDPSEASRPQVAKERYTKPVIDKSKIPTEVKVRAGEPFSLSVPVEEIEPIPTIHWQKDGKDIHMTDRMDVIESGNLAEVNVPRSVREDTGKYRLKLKNDIGEDFIDIKVNVVDKPQAPEGPLEVSDVTKTNAVLKWKPPKDDGGEPISHYVLEKMDTARGSWVDAGQTAGPECNFQVENLMHDKEYKFRVKAVNVLGESAPLDTEKGVVAKNPYDEPGQPGTPEVTDWDIDHIDIKWAPPANDGGAPIEKYVIEMKDKAKGTWEPGTEVRGDKHDATIPNLEEDHDYEFRVIAVNKAGPGEPSEASRQQRAKPRHLAPRIDLGALKDIRVKAGQPFSLDIPIVGEPMPEVHWTNDGGEIHADDRVEFENTPTAVILNNKCARRGDTGEYTLTLSNESGRTQATCKVVVLDKPASPEGPLDVEDITAEGCTLKWKPPKDDGGSDLNYKVEKKDAKKGTWVPVCSYVPGTSYHVGKLQEGHEYEFRVIAENVHGESEPLVTTKPMVAKNPFNVSSSPGQPKITDSDRDHITLSWDPPRSDGGSPITGYDIERREKTSGRWMKVNKEPCKKIEYTDNSVKDGKYYEYRVVAQNKAGNSAPSPPSKMHRARPMKEKPRCWMDGVPKEIRVRAGEPLDIDVPISGGPPPEVEWLKDGKPINEGFHVKMDNDDDDAKLHIPRCVRDDTGDYTIKLKNEFGEDTGDIKVIVLDKPSAPRGPVTPIDMTNDSVTLTWQKPTDDGGAEITGYMVEKCIEGSETWIRVPGSPSDTKFTVKNLEEGKKYKFRVSAENVYGTSEPVESKFIQHKNAYDAPGAPSQPAITEYHAYSISLDWKKPDSDGGNPIAGYMIERRNKGGNVWTKCNMTPVPTTNFAATGLTEGQTYEFRVMAVNAAGPGEPSQVSQPQVAKEPISTPDPPGTVTVDDITRNSADLSWEKPKNDGGKPITGYIIEKKKGDGEWEAATRIPAKDTSGKVKGLEEGETYQFRVRAINEEGDGEPSKPTDPIVALNQPAKPHIDVGKVKDIVVKHGEDFEIKIPYKGWPVPGATWENAGAVITPDNERIFGEQTEEFAILKTKQANRDDSGHYTLTLRNPSGSDTVHVNVTVLSPPTPPKGPLEGHDIEGDSLTLTWGAPKDDGGSDVSNYIVEKKEPNSNRWVKVSSFVPGTSCRVRNLEEGKAYEFRVCAENQYGVSEPLETMEPIVARPPYETPGAPSQPEATNHTDSSINLNWDPPVKDGGKPVRGYIVEKREKGEPRWGKALLSQVVLTSCTVPGLVPGKEYEFRVRAVNDAGPGKWSDASQALMAREPPAAPRIDLSLLPRDLVVKAGDPFKINIPYKGFPVPVADWVKDGEGIAQDKRITFDNEPGVSIFNCRGAKRGDSGQYRVTLKNDFGADSGLVHLTVIDVPVKPGGPLEASGVTPESCKLSWKVPEDDGGSPVSNYSIEKQDVATGKWDKVTAFCRQPEYTVMGLQEGHKYNFRVVAENEHGKSIPLYNDKPITAKHDFDPPGQPGSPTIEDYDSDMVELAWTRPASDGGEKLDGFIVECRELGDKDWHTATPVPVKETRTIIPNLQKGKEYEFRVVAKNAAGLGKPSHTSPSIKLRPKPKLASSPGMPQTGKIGKTFCELTWDPPRNDGGSPITSYIVQGRPRNSTNWTKMNDYSCIDPCFMVTGLHEGGEFEFRVIAVNAAGESEPSYATAPILIKDNAQAKPEFVRKLINSSSPTGKEVTLTCEAVGKPTPKARWFRDGVEVFTGVRVILKEENGVFHFTIPNVTEDDTAEYTCVCKNDSGSDTTSCKFTVQAPPRLGSEPDDQLVPEGDTHKVRVNFSGDGPFTVRLFKDGKEVPENDSVKVVPFDDFANITFKDANREDDGHYKVVIENDSGKCDAAFHMKVLAPPGRPTGPMNIFDVGKNNCTLSWKPPKTDGGSRVTHYVVEKRDTSRPAWTTVSASCKDTTFTPNNLMDGTEYEFRVMAVNENGDSEPLYADGPVTIRLPFDPPGPPGVPEIQQVGGDFVSLTWDKPSDDGGGRITGYWIEKREVNDDRWNRVNTQLCLPTIFNVSNLIEDRQYEFRIFAVNEAGQSKPSANSTPIKIKDPNAPRLPVFLRPLQNVMGVQDKSAQFECEIDCPPNTKIQWFKGTREIFPGSKHQMFHEGDRHFLVISNIFGEDADEYVCRATTRAGARASRADLKIKSPPKIKVPPRFQAPVTFEKGETIVIKLPFTGYPKPRAIWTHDGEDIIKGGHFDMEVLDRHAVLTIREPEKRHSGPYRLILENELGQDSCVVNVQVNDRPEPPRFPLIENVRDTSVSISWKPPLSDGGSFITEYVLEYCQPDGANPDRHKWNRVGSTRFTHFTVENLKPKTEYMFRIAAENFYGRSEPCEATAPIRTQDFEGSKRQRAGGWEDETGRKIRGKGPRADDYDMYWYDYYKKYVPQPVRIKHGSVYDDYDILEELGVGAFGVVHRCVERETGNGFAAKFINTSNPRDKRTIQNEIDIMNNLHHPKLLHLHDAYEAPDEMCMIMEFLSGGELFERITADTYKMTEAEAINYMRQVCDGLRHMHENNIVHLDIKPENVMATTNRSNEVKLIDFGLSAKLNPNEPVTVSTGTAEFAAPEIVDREPVGFYTDMWAIGVLAYVILSGLSPFAGDNDVETLKNIKRCDWIFEPNAFKGISDEAKDFIKSLILKDKKSRMTVHDALDHPWLKGDLSHYNNKIPNERYRNIRDKIRERYAAYPTPMPPIGRIANYSSLRKHRPKEYEMYESTFDRSEAAPRFIVMPFSTMAIEGRSATFDCRIIAPSPPVVSWYHGGDQLSQSGKYMQKYFGNDYKLVVNRCKVDDAGEYIVSATNSFGTREKTVHLRVERIPEVHQLPFRSLSPTRRRRWTVRMEHWGLPEKKAPRFDFALRSRFIQEGFGVKLSCCITGNPMPSVQWYKENVPITDGFPYKISYSAGMAELHLNTTKMADAGKYSLVASNNLGEAECNCRLSINPREDPRPRTSRRFTSSLPIDQIIKSEPSTPDINNIDLPRGPAKRYGAAKSQFAPEPRKPGVRTPCFTEKLFRQTVKEAQPVLFTCRVVGQPEPEVKWYKDGQELASSDAIDIKYKDGVCTLGIADTIAEDDGEYTCKAVSKEGYDSTSARLIIKA
ncbi:PREDICTED: twitchin-like isoform X3 [Priapulus caudatus]|uniref:Twitchin-like isoform X3 n=1 Tax=Priapulus caudatus TaxID=37621 RepID=A0ABM1DZT6_PRICU|nr:PREDICTED: twitchin-like isoform X3 [Priapulus caudatus]